MPYNSTSNSRGSITMSKLFFAILLSFVSLFFIQNLQAACTLSPLTRAVDFTAANPKNSFEIQTSQDMVSTTMGIECPGSLLSILGDNTVTATIINSSGFKLSKNSINIPYILCQDTNCTNIYQNGSTIIWRSQELLDLLELFGRIKIDLPLYLKILPSENTDLIAGTYNDTINIRWDWSICTSVNLLGICLSRDTGSETATINVTLEVTNVCEINSAPDVNFGSAALPSSFNTVNSNTLQTRCTKDANYSIKLTSTQGEIDGMRQMLATVNGSNYYLQYQLYRSGVAWTSTNDLSMTGLGTIQDIPYQAKINADQQNIPAGSYSDTVTVTITY